MNTPPRPGPAVAGPDFLVAGRYRLRSKIGAGGMGSVWLAYDQLLDREVAVKQVISVEGMNKDTADSARQRAMREGRIAARLSHRNAISMHDVALESGEPWLVMEYLPSRSVAQILNDTGTMSVDQVSHMGAQVADAMAEAHATGILHRDIKPGNILIASLGRQSGLVKITDFGISRSRDDVALTQTGIITGTPAYFAPEVARGDDPDTESDVFSLGATLYTALEGQPPFGFSENSLSLLHTIARGEITPPRAAGRMEKALLAALEPHPANRPTMVELREMLLAVAARGANPATVLATPLTNRDGSGWKIPSSTNSSAQQPNSSTPAPTSLPHTAQYTHYGQPSYPPQYQQSYPPHYQQSHPPQPSYQLPPPGGISAGALATMVFLGFVALSAIAVILIVLLR